MTLLSLEDSRVVIVGGTSGVGLATARQLAEAGTRKFALVGRNRERGEAARQVVLAARLDATVVFIAADVGQYSEAVRVVTEAETALAGIDVLVNSTSTGYCPDLFFRTPPRTCPRLWGSW